MELREILKKIEDLRRGLEELVKVRGIRDPEVATASRMLDAVLNE
ncbi:MAG: aspartyl-phosphate phosphatase Spo0E family protein [Bacillota bacterium]